MNNLTKALELYIADAGKAIGPAPMNRFHKEFEAARKSLERRARWQQTIVNIKGGVSELFAEELRVDVFGVAETSKDILVGGPSAGKVRAMVMAGGGSRTVDLDVIRRPAITLDGVLFFRWVIPKDLDPNVKRWEVVLVSASDQKVIAEPQIVEAGIEEVVSFVLSVELAKLWGVAMVQKLESHQLPFGLLLDMVH